MKTTCPLLLLVALTACAAPQKPSEAKQEVMRAAEQRLAAVVRGDLAALEQLLAPDFRYINVWGETSERAEYLEARRTSMNTPSDHWLGQDIDEHSIQFTMAGPDVALVTFRVLDHFKYEGTEHRNWVRSTYVYERVDGKWRCKLGHTSRIDPED